MTNITVHSQGNEISLEAIGHSGYAAAGEDIVCAAISTLLQTLTTYLEDNSDYCNVEINEGYLFVYARGGDARTAYEVIVTGLEMIEASYPDYIDIERGCTLQTYPSLI